MQSWAGRTRKSQWYILCGVSSSWRPIPVLVGGLGWRIHWKTIYQVGFFYRFFQRPHQWTVPQLRFQGPSYDSCWRTVPGRINVGWRTALLWSRPTWLNLTNVQDGSKQTRVGLFLIQYCRPIPSVGTCIVALLVNQGLAPATINTYLTAVHHAHIIRGLPDLTDSLLLPRLQLVQNGVQRVRVECGSGKDKQCCQPITPTTYTCRYSHTGGHWWENAVGCCSHVFLWIFQGRRNNNTIRAYIRLSSTFGMGGRDDKCRGPTIKRTCVPKMIRDRPTCSWRGNVVRHYRGWVVSS